MRIIYIMCWFFIFTHVKAQQSEANHLAKNPLDSIPLNPNVRHGTLPNGLQYYILKCAGVEKKINMQLVVNAGFPDEDADQANMSHLVEHLGLRRTANFPQGLKEFFIGSGLNYGSDFNASTASTTNYYIDIPTGDSALINKGFLALQDWAGGISFLPEDIAEERSAVFRETSNANNPSFFSWTNIKYRLLDSCAIYKPYIIPQMKNVMEAPIEALLRFYKNWYHPAYQAVIIVGDIDVAQTETQIRNYFAKLTNAGIRKKKNRDSLFNVKLSGKNRLLVSEPTSFGSKQIKIEILRKKQSERKAESERYRDKIMDSLFDLMMQNRLETVATPLQKLQFILNRNAIDPRAGIDAISIHRWVSETGTIKPALIEAFEETKKLEQYGFSEAELLRAKKTLASHIAQAPACDNASQRLLSYYTTGQPFPENEAQLKQKILSEITAKEINVAVREWLKELDNIDIIIYTPDVNAPGIPHEKQVFSWMADVQKSKVARYKEPVIKSLPSIKPSNENQYKVSEMPELGVTKVVFTNGATILLKPLPGQKGDDNVLLKVFNKHPSIDFDRQKELLPLLRNISQFAGVGSLSAQDIFNLVEEKRKTGELYLRAGFEGSNVMISGSFNIDNAETLFQLTNLYITNVTPDRAAFEEFCQRSRAENHNPKKANTILEDTIRAAMNLRTPMVNQNIYRKSMLDQAFHIYKTGFSKAANLVILIVGDFKKDTIMPMASRYFGSLPGDLEAAKSVQINSIPDYKSFPKEVVLVGDSAGNVNVRMLLKGKADTTSRSRMIWDIMARSTSALLFNRLREKEKGVYSVVVNCRYGARPENVYLDVAFETLPEDVNRLAIAVTDEIKLLASGKLSESIFSLAVSQTSNAYLAKIKSKPYWTDYLTDHANQFGSSSVEDFKISEILSAITPEDITRTAREFLNTGEYLLFKLL